MRPGFHILNKGPGDNIHAEWAGDNDGDGAGSLFLRLANNTMGLNIAVGPVITVPGRSSFVLAMDLPPGGLVTGQGAAEGANAMSLEVVNLATGQPLADGIHQFTMDYTGGDPTADLNNVRIGDTWYSPVDSQGKYETFILTSFIRYAVANFSFITTIVSRDGVITPNIEMSIDGVRTIELQYTKTVGTGETFLSFKQRVGF